MTDNVKWVAYMSIATDKEEASSEAASRVIKLLTVLNSNILLEEESIAFTQEDDYIETSVSLPNYLLGFAQSFQIGDYEIEIVAE
jgi:hypothetical protein